MFQKWSALMKIDGENGARTKKTTNVTNNATGMHVSKSMCVSGERGRTQTAEKKKSCKIVFHVVLVVMNEVNRW